MPMSSVLCPLEEGGPPRQTGTETREQHVVARLDPPIANRLLEGKRDGRARGVAVLVDVDGHPVERKPDPARGRLVDPEVGLVTNPGVDVLEGDARRVAHRVGRGDEDVNRELENI